ncbi:MAG: transcriptional repressor [Castellaniella sp.]|uniref:Fur family transcriptional regulator n=1 Tax=Castellaniella sp. TaxID=1955812 RepID=UPI001219D6D9|nr:Fur family transcriptional regulator [Castellaniella sp.]TAN31138.1 MAG: transcriptional repressor [Castellaniella sp.]
MSHSTTLTERQSIVLDALSHHAGPASAYALLEYLQGASGLKAPQQIYRVLDKLLELGLVHRIESLNAFVACDQPHHDHTRGLILLAICDQCGRVDESSDAAVERGLQRWASQHTFQMGGVSIEIHGTCGECAAHPG